jgi:hypothetical protein
MFMLLISVMVLLVPVNEKYRDATVSVLFPAFAYFTIMLQPILRWSIFRALIKLIQYQYQQTHDSILM